MSFRTAKLQFSSKIADARADAFGGSASDGTGDTLGNNLQLGATKFNAAFTKLKTQREIEEQGFRTDCHAVALIRRTLGLTIDVGTQLTYIPDNQIYKVALIVARPGHPEYRVALRRTE